MYSLFALPARLPAAMEILLLLLLASQAARLIWVALTPIGAIGTAASAAAVVDVQALPAVDVFFNSTMGSQPGSTATAGVALGYQLFGLRAGTGSSGSAILAGADGRQAAYLVGETIAPGITLEAVGSDFAVLFAGGGHHRLSLSAVAPPPSGVSSLPVGLEPPAVAPADTAVDAQKLFAQTGLLARNESGRVTGYTVVARGDGALLRQAGLQAGDVLLSVNGQTLSPERLGELQEELKHQPQVVIQFERNGQARSVTLQVPQP